MVAGLGSSCSRSRGSHASAHRLSELAPSPAAITAAPGPPRIDVSSMSVMGTFTIAGSCSGLTIEGWGG